MDDRTMQLGGIRPPEAIRGFSVSAGLTGLRRVVTLCWMSMAAFGRSLAVSGAISLVGPGLGMVPRAMEGVRNLAAQQRELARRWAGVEIPGPPGPLPPAPAGASGAVARYRWIMSDPQTRREYVWVLTDPIAGGFLGFFPLALILSGLWGVFLAFFGVPLSTEWDGLWYQFIPIEGQATAVLAGVLGLLQLPLALWAAPRAVRRHALYTRAMLAPSESEMMASRIQHLAATRSDAVDTQMAEIRRIERDLHDGAQARLVAMGMTLDAAEHLLETNPEAVRALLIEARQSSSAALEELRNLVRGIHPPVLADRGLADAVRALAMTCPVRTEVQVDLPGRPEMPVESAAYFAISEILTNVAKHAGAARAWIDLRYDRGMLHITVTDDGHGGADASRGTGLRGIERRLATFDGVLAVSSPVGGPTMVTMEIPCVLSSPKTTSS
ncbi:MULTISPECIES: sensor histidine kinase [Streptomyces]|uniref:histidine kinase n=1 Tax=Streptomyces canarius TaxID=285453 RepID=A0ABQ3CQF8_9ACTN|nr:MULTISPECIES: sensor domain-containing protein [Streptomyces]GGZ03873.1 histidine kinase [Streptomyces olivaceoviridis]GHA36002.1 histidine kinase [Streptomyces canarius]